MDKLSKFFSSLKNLQFKSLLTRRNILLSTGVLILIIAIGGYLLMRTTNFAEKTAIRGYFEDIGFVPEAEITADNDTGITQEEEDTTDENTTGDESSGDTGDTENDDSNSGNGNGGQNEPVTGVISPVYPTIQKVTDGIGHTQYSSFGQENMGNWTNPTIQTETKLSITIQSNNPNGSTLMYMFQYQPPNGSFKTLRNWSTNNTFTWTVPDDAIGKWLYINVSVKDADSDFRYGDSDDYTYLTYKVNPKEVEKEIYPEITMVSDSKGNVNKNSWGGDEDGGWSSGGATRKINAGDTITFTMKAEDPNGDAIQYRFMYQPEGGSFETLQDWSSSNTFTWTVPAELAGTQIFMNLGVKDGDKYLQFGDNDDYTYMIYNVQ